jgi:hypothetical protein
MQSFESINQLALPTPVQGRLQELKKRHAEGTLSAKEALELALLTEVEESLVKVRAKAATLLGSNGPRPIQPQKMIRNGVPVLQVPDGTPAIDPAAVRRFLEEEAF